MNSLPPPIPPPPVSPSNDQSNFTGPLRYDRLAIASLVCAIVILPSGGLTALPAFVLGIFGAQKNQGRAWEAQGTWHGLSRGDYSPSPNNTFHTCVDRYIQKR